MQRDVRNKKDFGGGKGRQKDVERKTADSMECCRLEL